MNYQELSQPNSSDRRMSDINTLTRRRRLKTIFANVLLTLVAVACLSVTAQAATFVVTNTSDTGAGSLRKAINDANGSAGADLISFNIPGAGVHTISPATGLPSITDPVTIDGYTQPGASVNTLVTGDDAVLLIEVDGSLMSGNSSGLYLGASGCVIRGLVINHFKGIGGGTGILIGTDNSLVTGNFIGINATGTTKASNDVGIYIASSGNTIGGTVPAARNVISGNIYHGVYMFNPVSTNNLIQGNFIGTDASGMAALGNELAGVTLIDAGANNIVGGPAPGAGNVISGNGNGTNGYGGVFLYGAVGGAKLQGNLIGTDVTGKVAVGNNMGVTYSSTVPNALTIGGTTPAERNVVSGNNYAGIDLGSISSGVKVSGNFIGTDITGVSGLPNKYFGVIVNSANSTIGGAAAGAGNVISGNTGSGLYLGGSAATGNQISGNKIGYGSDGLTPLGNTDSGIELYDANTNTIGGSAGNLIGFNGGPGVKITTVNAIANSISSNSISSNQGLGIDLDLTGVLPNDQGDSDLGANKHQNYPVLTSAILNNGATVVSSTLNSNANTQFRIEFFANASCDSSGYGEGQTYLGATNVTSDASGNASLSPNFAGLAAGQFITATATDPSGNTSEFSQCRQVQTPPPPTISINDVSLNEGNSGTTVFSFTVLLSAASSQAVSVNYTTADNTAQAASDYQAASGVVTFAPGETVKQLTVLVNGDTQFEPNETFFVNLSNPTSATITKTQGVGTILNDDAAQPGTLSFSTASYNVGENAQTITVSVNRSGGSNGAVSVQYATVAGGTATGVSDYTPTNGVLSWNDGESTTKTFTVTILDDSTNEATETINLALSNPTGGAQLGSPSTAVLSISDNDPPPTVSINDVSQAEGNSGTTAFTFTISLSAASGQSVSVSYTTADMTADASDYQAATGSVTFAAGETSKQITVLVKGDTQTEPNETFFVNLSNPTNATITKAQGIGTILNDDAGQPGTLSFSAASYNVGENAQTFTVNVNRSGGSNGAVSVQYATVAGGTATAGSDYTPTSGVLSWNDGESTTKTFTVTILDDSTNEATETVNLALSNPTGGAQLGSPSTVVLSINDNDPPPTVSINDVSQAEGNSGTTAFNFTISLSGVSGQSVSVNYTTADMTADSSDYQATNGSVTFAAGETSKQVTVLVNGDTQVEPNETFQIFMYNLQNAAVGKILGTGTIVNDDSVTPKTVQFSQANFSVNEDQGSVTITVSRAGDTSGVASVDYKTTDTDTFTVGCAAKQGQAFGRCDFATTVGTLSFAAGQTSATFTVPVINDSYAEGTETFGLLLSNPSGAILGAAATATVTINDNEAADGPNPLPNTSFFVRQHYLDFLSREPEVNEPWSGVLNGCSDQFNTDPNNPAAGCDRLVVSGSFFGSPEFRDKGLYVIDFYRVAFNRLPTYVEFSTDLASITGSTAAEANAKRAAFANSFVQRPEFTSIYGGMSNTGSVNALMNGNQGQAYNLADITTYDPMSPDGPTKITLSKGDLMNGLNSSSLTRAQVLRAIVQSDQVSLNLEAVNAFVASQYYGYLRRAPDQAGFNAWVTYLKNNPTDFRTMVNGFLNSAEYKLRFGP